MSMFAKRLSDLETIAKGSPDGIPWGTMQALADMYVDLHGDTPVLQAKRRAILNRDSRPE